MNCSNCGVKLLKNDELCRECKFDDTVTISKTNVKRLYKLTDLDLDDPDLYYFTYQISYGFGTRFIIEDIENLIEKLSDHSIDDKRYVAMTKIRNQREEEKNQSIVFNGKKNVIKELLRTMIEKTNLIEYMDQMRFLIDNDLYIGIEDYDVDGEETCDKLLDVIEKKAISIFKLNQLIKDHYKDQYDLCIEVLKPYSVLYDECIHHEIYREDKKKRLGKLFDELNKKIKVKEQNDRSVEIENILVRENQDICENEYFYEYVRMTTGYKKYVEGLSDQNANDVAKKIGKSVKLKIEKKERKDAIDAKLEDHCSGVETMESYKKYVNHAIGLDIDEIAKKIKSELADARQRQAEAVLMEKKKRS